VGRLGEVRKELAALEDTLQPLLIRYNQEKERLDNVRRLQVILSISSDCAEPFSRQEAKAAIIGLGRGL
jgi:hypothetical protein